MAIWFLKLLLQMLKKIPTLFCQKSDENEVYIRVFLNKLKEKEAPIQSSILYRFQLNFPLIH